MFGTIFVNIFHDYCLDSFRDKFCDKFVGKVSGIVFLTVSGIVFGRRWVAKNFTV